MQTSRLYQQLCSALDLADRQTEKGRSEPDTVKVRELSNFEDSKRSYYTTLTALIDLVGPSPIEGAWIYGVYTRDSFEKRYALNWT